MKFRTVFQPYPSQVQLNIHKPVLFFGSCFSDYICARMKQTLWKGENLGGALYNPISIAYALKILLLEEDENSLSRMIKDSLIENGGVWHSLLFDSSCSDIDKVKVEEKIRSKRSMAQAMMNSGAEVIVTFGTAWTFALISDVAGMEGKIVGNCHKLPANLFERRLLNLEEIIEEWTVIISELRQRWPKVKFIFTLSPVRHLKDGLSGNSLSKSILRISIDRLIRYFNTDNEVYCDYFPAYEILNDDLRDYRFYDSDLVHPSMQAVEYIWGKFIETYLKEVQRKLLIEGEKFTKAKNHRPLIYNQRDIDNHLQEIRNRYLIIKQKWPEIIDIDFD